MESSGKIANTAEYECLFKLENVLRNFIIQDFQPVVGGWHALKKHRFPAGDEDKKRIEKNLKRWKEEQEEKSIDNTSSYHPLYFFEFVDLIGIIKRNDNWNDFFKEKFTVNKTDFEKESKDCFPIRNRIAHSRYCRKGDLATLEKFSQTVKSAVGGSNNYDELFLKSYEIANADDLIERYQTGIKQGFQKILKLESLEEEIISLLNCIEGEEFVLDKVLNFSQIETTSELRNLILNYHNLPSGRGSIKDRREWKKVHGDLVMELAKDLELEINLDNEKTT